MIRLFKAGWTYVRAPIFFSAFNHSSHCIPCIHIYPILLWIYGFFKFRFYQQTNIRLYIFSVCGCIVARYTFFGILDSIFNGYKQPLLYSLMNLDETVSYFKYNTACLNLSLYLHLCISWIDIKQIKITENTESWVISNVEY